MVALFLQEGPIGPIRRLAAAPNIFFQPHTGSATVAARQRMQVLCVDNIKAVVVDGKLPLTAVSRPASPKIFQAKL